MATIPLYTYKDLLDHLVDYLGDNASQGALRDARRAAQDAYRDLAHAFEWCYYVARGRVNTVQPYSTGTIAYDHTGGSSERLVTLTGGTFPSWAASGQLVINSIVYEVAQRLSSTTLQLTIGQNPGADVASGTSYTLYQDGYPLPYDFISCDRVIDMRRGVKLSYEHPRSWMARQQVYQGPSAPYVYTFTQDEHSFGALAIRLFPIPDNIYPLDFIYKRKPRALVIDQYSAGTASVAASSTTVTGSGTSWTSAMVGSVIRLSSDNVNAPTGVAGANRAAEENVITDVASATSLTIDAAITTDYSGVKYVISDPVDVEYGAMLTALLRGMEAQGTIARIMKNEDRAQLAYRAALVRAMEADRRSTAQRVPGAPPHFLRLRDFPVGADMG